jgi:cytoskeletal protein RodZ
MQSVGTRLLEARIKKGYTLEDINARTRISLKNLNAIESDDLSRISSPFTYRSFVKQVADTLGTDFSALAPDVQAASSTMPEPLVPGQEEELFVRPHQFQQVKPKRNFSWVSRTISIVIIVAAISGFLIWRHGGIQAAKLPSVTLPASSRVASPDQDPTEPIRTEQIAPPPMLTPVVNKVEQPQGPAVQQLSPPPTTPDTSAARVQPELEISAPIHIELSAVERAWLSISADGKTTYTGVLDPSQTKVLEGRDSARIRTANAGAVNIVFNGRSLGPLGRRGQSRTFVFTRKGYEVVRGASNVGLTHPAPNGE